MSSSTFWNGTNTTLADVGGEAADDATLNDNNLARNKRGKAPRRSNRTSSRNTNRRTNPSVPNLQPQPIVAPVITPQVLPPAPVFNAPAGYQVVPRGNSTRDAVFNTVNTGLGVVGNWLAGRNQVRHGFAAPLAVDANGVPLPPGTATHVAAGIGAGAGSFLDSTASGLGISTSTLMLIGGGALLLMMMKPPGSRR